MLFWWVSVNNFLTLWSNLHLMILFQWTILALRNNFFYHLITPKVSLFNFISDCVKFLISCIFFWRERKLNLLLEVCFHFFFFGSLDLEKSLIASVDVLFVFIEKGRKLLTGDYRRRGDFSKDFDLHLKSDKTASQTTMAIELEVNG